MIRILTLAGLLLIVMAPTSAESAEAAHKDRAQYQQLLRQRQQLVSQLARLDTQAAQAVRQGQDPVSSYAEQVGLQDQLDLVELRLEIAASRLGEVVPPIESVSPGGEAERARQAELRARRALDRGVSRTMHIVRRDGRAMLASLDFSAFLREP